MLLKPIIAPPIQSQNFIVTSPFLAIHILIIIPCTVLMVALMARARPAPKIGPAAPGQCALTASKPEPVLMPIIAARLAASRPPAKPAYLAPIRIMATKFMPRAARLAIILQRIPLRSKLIIATALMLIAMIQIGCRNIFVTRRKLALPILRPGAIIVLTVARLAPVKRPAPKIGLAAPGQLVQPVSKRGLVPMPIIAEP